MKKLKILTLDAYSNSVVSSLHEEEIVEIQDISERIQQDAEWKQILKQSKATAYTGKLSSLQMKTTGIVDFLKSAERKEGGILKSVMGFINPKVPEKKEVEDLDTGTLIEHAESILDKVEEQTKTIENKINILDSEKNELSNALNVATKLKNIDVDLNDLEDTNYTSTITGKMSSVQFEEFKKEVSSITDKIVILEQDEEESKVLIIITLKEHGSEVSSLLRRFEFELYSTSGLSGKPAAIIQSTESRITEIENERAQLMDNLADIAKEWKDDLLVLKEQLEIEKNRNEIFSSFGETNRTLMLEAWVPAKKADKAVEIINESSEGHSIIEVTDPEEGDDIPIHLDNPRFAKPYEMFVHMYSPPGYKEIDPTIFLALMFPFFFGFCLTDAGYGLADVIIGIVMILGLGKINKMMRNMGIIMVTGGLWAVILGTITNSFLGDLYGRFLIGDPNVAIPGTVQAVNAFANPQNILILAIAVGVIYTSIGLIIGARNNLVAGKTKEALGEQISWLMMFVGVGLAGASFLLGLSSILLYVGGAIAVIAIIMFLYVNGPFGIMDLMGMIGNILSYARLLALGLATGGIAMTVNIFVQLVTGIPYIGLILVPIIFVFGHIANGAFQTFGGIINALRLHYVEFFGQFYIGGSQKFRAFRTKRRITKLGGK